MLPDSPASDGSSPHGLRAGALGPVVSAGAGAGAGAPAYGLAAVLGWAAADDGPRALLLAVLALVPVLASAWTQRELSRASPDCGTSFAWVSRAFGPRAGWFCGGWARIAADLLVLAVQARIAGEYVFVLAGLPWIGQDAISPLVVAAGLAVIAALAWLGRRGASAPARLQAVTGGFSVAVLLVLAAAALVKAASGHGAASFSWSWLDPAAFPGPGAFASGMTLMVFAYWGWDTAFSLGEETAGRARGLTSALTLGGTVVAVALAAQLAAGDGLGDPGHLDDALSPLGTAVFGGGPAGAVATRLLALAVLASVAGGIQGRLLTASRTVLSMASAGALPRALGRVHPRFRTPARATVAVAAAGAVLFAALTYASGGDVLADAVTSAGFFIALYLAATGFAGFWLLRRTPRGLIPLAGGVMMTGTGAWSVWFYAVPDRSYSVWRLPPGHWAVGGVLGVGLVAAVTGLAVGLPWILRIKDINRIHLDTRMLPIAHPPLQRWTPGESRKPFSPASPPTSVKVRTSLLTLCHP